MDKSTTITRNKLHQVFYYYLKNKSGQIMKRHDTRLFKHAIIWIEDNWTDEVVTAEIEIIWGWGKNSGEYKNLNDAIWFIRENRKDYLSWKTEGCPM